MLCLDHSMHYHDTWKVRTCSEQSHSNAYYDLNQLQTGVELPVIPALPSQHWPWHQVLQFAHLAVRMWNPDGWSFQPPGCIPRTTQPKSPTLHAGVSWVFAAYEGGTGCWAQEQVLPLPPNPHTPMELWGKLGLCCWKTWTSAGVVVGLEPTIMWSSVPAPALHQNLKLVLSSWTSPMVT